MVNESYTLKEIQTQAAAWEDALAVVDAQRAPLARLFERGVVDNILFTGCGSTYYLSLAAAALFQEMAHISTRAAPAGELLLNPGTVLSGGRTLLVAVSRSGSTTETLRAVEAFRRGQAGPVLAITNYGGEPLAGLADLALVIEEGQEHSIAQTRSFASMYVAAAACACLASRRDDELASMQALPAIGDRLLKQFGPAVRSIGENLNLDRFYFLGSGSRYGLACEASLKMKEMTLSHSEPFHFLEFRHGPMSMVSPSALVVGLVSSCSQQHERRVLEEMRARQANILDLGEADCLVNFESGLSEAVRNVLYLPLLQWMAYYRSAAKGLDADRPENLSAVVKLNL